MNKTLINYAKKKREPTIIMYLLVVLLASILFIGAYDLFNRNLSYPILPDTGDAVFFQTITKGMQEFGWINYNPNLGAPFGRVLFDFPFFSDYFNFFVAKILILATGNWVSALNLNYYLIFILTSIFSYYVLKKLKINNLLSIMGALTYTFLPYRFFRSMSHILLNCYYFIPIIVLILIRLYSSKDFLTFNTKETRKESVKTLIFIAIFSLSGMYYAFFACYFIIITILIKTYELSYLKQKGILTVVKKGLFLIGEISVSLFLAYIPSILYNIKWGSNSLKPVRELTEIGLYDQKISDLLIPSRLSQSFPFFNDIITKNNSLSNSSEKGSFLGLLGFCGFIILILLIFVPFQNIKRRNVKNVFFLSKLNIAGVLLGIGGGLSTIFAVVVTPSIRAYGRLNPYTAFFSISAAIIVIQNLLIKIKNNHMRTFSYGLVSVVLLLGLFSQISFIPFDNAQYDNIREIETFVKDIEDIMPENSLILQFPYMQFPEVGFVNDLRDYDLSRPYLYSQKIAWSYGGYKGRSTDILLEKLNSLSIENQLEMAVLMGYSGIYIDAAGYNFDDLEMLKNQINKYTKSVPILSATSQYIFYNIEDYVEMQKKKTGIDEFHIKQANLLSVIPSLANGFSCLEFYENNEPFYWSEAYSELNLINTTDHTVTINLSFVLNSSLDASLVITSEENTTAVNFSDGEQTVLLENIKLTPGENIITFLSDTTDISEIDPRDLSFQISSLQTELVS